MLGHWQTIRAALFPLVPVLSRDAYRYAWDALLTAHGFSPYLHAPNWPGFAALRDAFYPHVPWKTVPTIYPPGAQLLYRVAYLFAPKNVWAIKAEMVAFDLLAGLLLALLLRRHGQDMRRAFLYLWAPLPVVEYSLNGHVDAVAIALTLLILLVNEASFRGARAVMGGLLGFAALVKLYPLVFVVALLRRRDWALLLALAATLFIGYLPFWDEGLAASGFLGSYLRASDPNYGGVALLVRALAAPLGQSVVQALSALGAAAAVGLIIWLRVRPATTSRAPSLSSIQATYALVAVWLIFGPHVFAWYVPALLPFCALYLARPARRVASACAVGILAFCCLIPLSYVAFEVPRWAWLYPALYPACLALALGVWLWRRRQLHTRPHAQPAVEPSAPTASPNPDDVLPLRIS